MNSDFTDWNPSSKKEITTESANDFSPSFPEKKAPTLQCWWSCWGKLYDLESRAMWQQQNFSSLYMYVHPKKMKQYRLFNFIANLKSFTSIPNNWNSLQHKIWLELVKKILVQSYLNLISTFLIFQIFITADFGKENIAQRPSLIKVHRRLRCLECKDRRWRQRTSNERGAFR